MTRKYSTISLLLIIVVVAVLATATIVERIYGTQVAASTIYGAWWFVALWALLAISAIVVIVKTKLYRRPFTLLIHLALLLILGGALITWLTAKQGTLTLQRDAAPVHNVAIDGDKDGLELPFDISLKSFEVLNYDGTPTPMDFVTRVVINDNGATSEGEVSMNNVLSHRGYRFFQSGFDSETGASVLKVQYDPAGIAVTYCGYAALVLAFLLFFLDKKSAFRTLLKQARAQRSMLLVAAVIAALSASAQPRTVSPQVADSLGNIYVLNNGRISPMSTLARDFTTKLCGKNSYKGLSANQVFAGWMFFPSDWRNEPVIKVKSGQVRDALGIEGKMACYNDFYTTTHELKLQSLANRAMNGDEEVDNRGLNAVNEQFGLIGMAMTGNLLKIYPVTTADTLQWYTPADRLPASLDEQQYIFISKGIGYLNELVQMGDDEHAVEFLSKLKQWQEKQAGSVLPSNARIKAEQVFNSISSTRPIAMAAVTLGIIAFVFYCFAMGRRKPVSKAIKIAVNAAVVLLAVYLTVIIVLRWIAGGHVPLSNGSETMQFMAWAACVLSLAMQRRFSIVLPMGLLVAGLTMMVAMMGEANPQVTLLMPVLSSPLLSIHVVVIMMAYSLFAFMMMSGVAALVLRRNADTVTRLATMSRLMLYPAVFLLAVGIFVGAVWANVSWGRYWGWDPKEVWALITMLIYCLPLHARSLPRFARPVTYHIYCIVAFLSVVITYFGVNLLLGGMHSYA